MSKGEGKKISIKFTQPIVNIPVDGIIEVNPEAFTISGEEYLYVNGPDNNGELLEKQYYVKNVNFHPTESNAILLEIENPFNSVECDLTVSYNKAKGTIEGLGGLVESFEETFTPIGLVKTPNPGITEYINTDLDLGITLVELIFTKGYNTEYINTELTLSIELMNIDDINP